MASVFVKYLFLVSFVVSGCAAQLKKLQRNHTPQQLSNSDVRYLAGLSDPSYTNYVLDKILIPRVVGTPNHELVFNFITSQLEKLGWDIEVDEFQEKTPNFGILTFKNIVATLNPHAERYLVLACHYDSKYFEKEIFVGATDSAVPCAMMLNLAKVMHRELNQTRDSELSLKLIFFDGEEAFVNWGPKDSIYGAKHLAAKYHNDVKVSRLSGENVSELDKIDMLVLLDLIGHKDITFYSYFQETGNWYLRLCDAEDQLDKLGLMTRHRKYFLRRMSYGRIEDDHLPFLRKNVPILHLIASPFPREWHTPGDNRDIIDENAVENINKILRIFIAEYFHIYLSDPSEEKMLPEKEL